MVGLTSAAGLVGFLSEPDPELQTFALRTLDETMEFLWTEVAGSLGQIEALYEDESFPNRDLAALVAAKVYYHLQEYNESMVFALGAGKLFKLDRHGEFEETIISKCIDTYIAMSAMQSTAAPTHASNQTPLQLTTAFPGNTDAAANMAAILASPTTPFSQSTLPSKSLLSRQNTAESVEMPSSGPGSGPNALSLQKGVRNNLQGIIDRLFERCFDEGRYKQVVGIAVEARNLDILRRVILRASDDEKKQTSKVTPGISTRGEELMEYVLDICMSVIQERVLRNDVRN
jgi:26S proteasome regulatory subunit N2